MGKEEEKEKNRGEMELQVVDSLGMVVEGWMIPSGKDRRCDNRFFADRSSG